MQNIKTFEKFNEDLLNESLISWIKEKAIKLFCPIKDINLYKEKTLNLLKNPDGKVKAELETLKNDFSNLNNNDKENLGKMVSFFGEKNNVDTIKDVAKEEAEKISENNSEHWEDRLLNFFKNLFGSIFRNLSWFIKKIVALAAIVATAIAVFNLIAGGSLVAFITAMVGIVVGILVYLLINWASSKFQK